MPTSWRDIARPIIYNVLQEHTGETDKAKRKALKEAYPWGQRAMHPYKIWCDEVKVQMGKKKFGKKNNTAPKEQLKMF